MDTKFYLQLNAVNLITIALMWFIISLAIGGIVRFTSSRSTADETA